MSRVHNIWSNWQLAVGAWMAKCFTPAIANDKVERNHRFLEESLELAQAAGCSQGEAYQLVDYVFARPVGELGQEVGGVAVTLAALCNAHALHLPQYAVRELDRCYENIDKIRAKHAAKPKFGPLPQVGGSGT